MDSQQCLGSRARRVGLALVAVAALTMVAAASASAQARVGPTSVVNFTGREAPLNGTGTTDQVFQVGMVPVTCTTAQFTGTKPAGLQPSVTVTPRYPAPGQPGCIVNLGGPRAATVTVCADWIVKPTSPLMPDGSATGSIELLASALNGPCGNNAAGTAGNNARINVGGLNCNIDVPAQTLTSGGSAQNVPATNPTSVRVDANSVGPVAYTTTCPISGQAFYTGSVLTPGIWLVP